MKKILLTLMLIMIVSCANQGQVYKTHFLGIDYTHEYGKPPKIEIPIIPDVKIRTLRDDNGVSPNGVQLVWKKDVNF